MATTAEDIVNTPDRTMRERRDWAEFVGKSKRISRTMDQVTFTDGSAILMELDGDLIPTEIVIV